MTMLAFADEPQACFDALGTMFLPQLLYPLLHDALYMVVVPDRNGTIRSLRLACLLAEMPHVCSPVAYAL